MKWPARCGLAAAIVLIVLGSSQYALQRAGQSRLARFIATSRSWANISVGSAHFWLWGVVDLRDIRIEPTVWLAGFYGLPLGYTADVEHLRATRFRLGWKHGPTLASAAFAAHGIHIPVPSTWDWTIPLARGQRGRPLRLPTPSGLGIGKVDFNATGTVHFPDGRSKPVLHLHTRLPTLANIALGCALYVPESTTSDPGAAVIRHCRLVYRDKGLVKRFEAQVARDNDISVAQAQRAISRQLDHASILAGWPATSRSAMQAFIHAPATPLQLDVHPRKPLALNDIPRGVWPGLPKLIGLKASLPRE